VQGLPLDKTEESNKQKGKGKEFVCVCVCVCFVYFASLFFETRSGYINQVARNSLCSPGWPSTHDPLSSAFQVLVLEVCTTPSSFDFFFLLR
jgi:hypothetical protein